MNATLPKETEDAASKIPSPLFHHAPQISYLNCFSLLRAAGTVRLSRAKWRTQLEKKIWKLGESHPKSKSQFANKVENDDDDSETEFRDYQQKSGVNDVDRWLIVKGRGGNDLEAFDGLRAMAYMMLSMYLTGFCQKDLLMKNRWKEVEMMETKKEIWAVIASVWAYLDILFFFSAFFQGLKLLQFF